jgi:cytochrome c oxidase subunit 2
MNIKLAFNELNDFYQKWQGEEKDSLSYNLNTGLVLVVFFYFFLVFFVYKMYYVLNFNVSFFDPSSVFAENLIHLYNIVWIVLIFVIFLILVLLIRIIYLFSWNFSYFSSALYLNFIIISLEYYLSIALFLQDEEMIDSATERLSLIETNSEGLNTIGLNLWYNKNVYKFMSVSDISEYRYLEVIWCLLPIGSLLLISIPTFSLIFSLDSSVDPVYTIKVIGRQWYWTYDLDVVINNNIVGLDSVDVEKLKIGDNVEKGKQNQVVFLRVSDYNKYALRLSDDAKPISFEFDSNLVFDDDLSKGTHRLLEVDNRLFLPVGVPIRLLITSTDVLHSWAVPSLGIKVDAVPGRLNQFVVEIKRPGVFYGQCSELCGPFHGFMPIVIQAVSLDKFEQWLVSKVE